MRSNCSNGWDTPTQLQGPILLRNINSAAGRNLPLFHLGTSALVDSTYTLWSKKVRLLADFVESPR